MLRRERNPHEKVCTLVIYFFIIGIVLFLYKTDICKKNKKNKINTDFTDRQIIQNRVLEISYIDVININ